MSRLVYAETGLDGKDPGEQSVLLWDTAEDAIEADEDGRGVALYELCPPEPRWEPYGIHHEHLDLIEVIRSGVS